MLLVPRPAERASAGAGLPPPRSLVVDRQSLFLAALDNLLSGPPLLSEVTVLKNSASALELLADGGFDLLFCEVNAEPLPGEEVVEKLRQAGVSTRVVLLADPEDRRLLIEALPCGAAGFLTKDTSFEELVDSVEAVRAGHYVLGHNLFLGALDSLTRAERREPDRPARRLSQSEMDILILVGQARSIADIAARRGITEKTVRNHLANIYRKMELRSRTEAILLAARLGLTGAAGTASAEP